MKTISWPWDLSCEVYVHASSFHPIRCWPALLGTGLFLSVASLSRAAFRDQIRDQILKDQIFAWPLVSYTLSSRGHTRTSASMFSSVRHCCIMHIRQEINALQPLLCSWLQGLFHEGKAVLQSKLIQVSRVQEFQVSKITTCSRTVTWEWPQQIFIDANIHELPTKSSSGRRILCGYLYCGSCTLFTVKSHLFFNLAMEHEVSCRVNSNHRLRMKVQTWHRAALQHIWQWPRRNSYS